MTTFIIYLTFMTSANLGIDDDDDDDNDDHF
jgi:hypothetical protein